MSIHGENKCTRTIVDGEVFLQARPVYDESSQRIRVEEVAFEIKTKSSIQNLAAWLLNDLVCKKIEESLTLDVHQQAAKLKQAANERFSAVKVAPGVCLNSKLNTIKLTGIKATDSLLILGFDLAGELTCNISATAFKP